MLEQSAQLLLSMNMTIVVKTSVISGLKRKKMNLVLTYNLVPERIWVGHKNIVTLCSQGFGAVSILLTH